MTPYMYRGFDGRRTKWDGAREAIISANEDARSIVLGCTDGRRNLIWTDHRSHLLWSWDFSRTDLTSILVTKIDLNTSQGEVVFQNPPENRTSVSQAERWSG